MNYNPECFLLLIKQNIIFNVLGNEFWPTWISWFHNYTALKSVFVMNIYRSLNQLVYTIQQIASGTELTKITEVASCF